MNPTSQSTYTSTVKSAATTFAQIAVVLAVTGVVWFVLFSMMHLGGAAVGGAMIAEVLAFISGMLGWRERAARVVVFTQLSALILFAISVAIYMTQSNSKQPKSTADPRRNIRDEPAKKVKMVRGFRRPLS